MTLSHARIRRRLWITWLVLALAVSLPLPGSAPAQDDDFPRTLRDSTGRALTIPARPAGVLLAGELPLLGAIMEADAIQPVELPPQPGAVRWDAAGLLVMPELYAAAYPALLDAAAASQTPVFLTRPITSLEDWRTLVHQLGRATGRDARAGALVARLDAHRDTVRERLHGTTPARVLVLTPEGYTFGADTLMDAIITAAGAINVAAEAGYDDFRQIDDRAIRALNPDVILLAPAWTAVGQDAFRANPALADVTALRNNRIAQLSFSPTAPPDPAAAITALAWGLYPQRMLCAR